MCAQHGALDIISCYVHGLVLLGLEICRNSYNSDAIGLWTECTALFTQEAMDWTDGRAVYASGTAFPAITRADGSQYVPSQANNSLIFPGKSPTMLVLLGYSEKVGKQSVATG